MPSPKQQADKNYRARINQDVEGLATRARVMTGKPASQLTNDQVRSANNQYDDMDRRESKNYGLDVTHTFVDNSDDSK